MLHGLVSVRRRDLAQLHLINLHHSVIIINIIITISNSSSSSDITLHVPL